jgi:hypothetical protein
MNTENTNSCDNCRNDYAYQPTISMGQFVAEFHKSTGAGVTNAINCAFEAGGDRKGCQHYTVQTPEERIAYTVRKTVALSGKRVKSSVVKQLIEDLTGMLFLNGVLQFRGVRYSVRNEGDTVTVSTDDGEEMTVDGIAAADDLIVAMITRKELLRTEGVL